MRIRAKVFADGIPPDVRRNFFDGVGRTKNVVVITHLPKSFAAEFSKFKSSALFEQPDKLAQIGSVVRAFCEEVDVIGHNTIRVKEKRVAGGTFEKSAQDDVCRRCSGEE